MVLAGEDARFALFLVHDWEGTMPADVVETIDLSLTVTSQDKLVISNIVSEPVARVGEP